MQELIIAHLRYLACLLSYLAFLSCIWSSAEVDAECAVVRVEEPSAQLVEKAQQFQLSRFFYNFLNAAPCPGCVGCDPDSFDFSTIGQRPKHMNTAGNCLQFLNCLTYLIDLLMDNNVITLFVPHFSLWKLDRKESLA